MRVTRIVTYYFNFLEVPSNLINKSIDILKKRVLPVTVRSPDDDSGKKINNKKLLKMVTPNILKLILNILKVKVKVTIEVNRNS